MSGKIMEILHNNLKKYQVLINLVHLIWKPRPENKYINILLDFIVVFTKQNRLSNLKIWYSILIN
jgi:hypothetical protein